MELNEVEAIVNYSTYIREKSSMAKGISKIELEPVFDPMKNNLRLYFEAFKKVSLEVGWLLLAHNLLKKAAVDAKNQGAK